MRGDWRRIFPRSMVCVCVWGPSPPPPSFEANPAASKVLDLLLFIERLLDGRPFARVGLYFRWTLSQVRPT
eukprot:4270321-Pyramimonas_sp.AAC.1